MTATELYEIVKDVPREALVGMHHEGAFGWFNLEGGAWIPPNVAELAFIGSMARWLLDRDAIIQRLVDGRYGIRIPVWKAGRDSELIGANWHLSPTLIESLAAACKAVKP